jgi:hypothetical protein
MQVSTDARCVVQGVPGFVPRVLRDAERSIARHRRGTSPKLPKSEQDAAVERVVRTDELTASHPNSNWVFHGYSPGRHIHGSSLRSRLKTVFSTRAARLGTLHELTKLGPVPIIADALGYHPSTIERHAFGSASTYAEYIAAARELRQTS